jgi:hypothetical protein
MPVAVPERMPAALAREEGSVSRESAGLALSA